MTKIPYCFIWSDNYKIFADILNWGINNYSYCIENKNIYISQNEFDKFVNKVPGHHFNGCFIKLEKTLELLNTLPENSYFIFSDADILLIPNKKLNELLNLYISMDLDCVFMRETPESNVNNIGFSLLKVNDYNRELFKNALTNGYNNPTSLDQSLINGEFKNYKGKHAFFPTEFVMTSSTLIYYSEKNYDAKMREQLIVFQALCDPTQSKENVFYQKLSQYKMLGFPIQFS